MAAFLKSRLVLVRFTENLQPALFTSFATKTSGHKGSPGNNEPGFEKFTRLYFSDSTNFQISMLCGPSCLGDDELFRLEK